MKLVAIFFLLVTLKMAVGVEEKVQEEPLSVEEQLEMSRDDQFEEAPSFKLPDNECKPKKGRKKTMKKMKHWFEKKVLLLPPET